MSSIQRSLLLMLGISACALGNEQPAVGEGALPATAPPRVYFPPDVVGQFNAVTDRADALGFGIGASPDPSLCYHYQGIARASGPGTPYLFVSKSGNQPSGVPCLQWCTDLNVPCTEVGDGPGNLLVVKMASRADDGERLRSNRLVRDTETEDSAPDPQDVVVKVISFDGQSWPSAGHPGGLQVVGDVLVLPLENPYEGDPNENRILFIDVSNPEEPALISTLVVPINDDFSTGTLGVASLPDGRFLLLVTGKDNIEVRFYESSASPLGLHDPALAWELADTWFPEDDPVPPALACERIPPGQDPNFPQGLYGGWPDKGLLGGAFQSTTFVRQGGPDGPLFLIGARNTSQIFGDDWFDLFEVARDGEHWRLSCAAQRHVHSFPASDGATFFHNNIANFAAASGSYVSPTGELVLYATEHDNDGPNGSVKMGEWRHRDMVRPDSPTYDPTADPGGPYTVPEGSVVTLAGQGEPPRTKAWIELWTDPDWEDDRYLVIDYPDWSLDDFDDFKDLDDANLNPFAIGFSDQATSARWYAPTGCTLRLNDDDFGDGDFPGSNTRTLPGDGTVGGVAHLSNLDNDNGGGGLNDELTSAQFFADCDAYYDPAAISFAWDVDGDGTYETPAGASFSAAALDGPAVLSVAARAVHSMDGRAGAGAATVTVVNVPPAVPAPGMLDGAGRVIGVEVPFAIAGLPVRLTGSFTDPGLPDTHVAAIGWGDGATTGMAALDSFTAATGGAVGGVLATHAYAAAGTFTASLTVTDDDGGAGASAATIQVVDAAGALESVIDQLDALLPGRPKICAKALEGARDDLDGNHGGAASNGALDKLQGGQLVAAMVKLQAALTHLEVAGGLCGLDLESLQATVAVAAHAIAQKSYLDAVAESQPPSPSEVLELAVVQGWLESGAEALSVGDWLGAVSAFKLAVQTSSSMD
ncbi:MAG: PKD domain-containing protein [Polyangiaceae bacterium]